MQNQKNENNMAESMRSYQTTANRRKTIQHIPNNISALLHNENIHDKRNRKEQLSQLIGQMDIQKQSIRNPKDKNTVTPQPKMLRGVGPTNLYGCGTQNLELDKSGTGFELITVSCNKIDNRLCSPNNSYRRTNHV